MSHDRDRRRMLLAGVGAVGALAMARTARAACGDPGPLGPTGPTMRQMYDKIADTDVGTAEARTPIQSLPSGPGALYHITTRGVYYLTDHVLGVASMAAVLVDADDVEIECDGFCFVGVPGTRQGILSTSPHHRIVVCDATFVNWQETCIDLSTSTDCYAETIWLCTCDCTTPFGLGGIALGDGGTFDDCNVLECISAHLRGGANSIYEENVIRGSVSSSIISIGPAVAEDNFLTGNTGSSGISIDTGAVVMGNRLVSSSGIFVGGDSIVQENDLSLCAGGIVVNGSNSTVEENSVSSGGDGISVVAPATRVMVEGNNVLGCTGTGISVVASSSSLIVRNSVSSSPGGTPYSIGIGNPHGSIVNVAGVDDIGTLGIALDTWINFQL